MSQIEIYELMKQHPHKKWKAQDIADALKTTRGCAGAKLNRLVKHQLIKKIEHSPSKYYYAIIIPKHI